MNIDSKDDAYDYFEAMEKQFPMLEQLFLNFDTGTDFTLNRLVPCFGASKNTTYEAVYFANLQKLSVFAFEQCDDIFNYLKISNAKLTDISFMGMNADKTLIQSLLNYPKLRKLKLDCPYVYEDTKYFHWESSDMLEFIKKSVRLRRLQIDVDRKGRTFQIDQQFKDEFQQLIENGRKFLTLHIKCFGSSQEIELSRKKIFDKPPSASSSADESNGGF